jgi:hypothetical protein
MGYYTQLAKMTGRPLAEWEAKLDAELDEMHRREKLAKVADDDKEKFRAMAREEEEDTEENDAHDDDNGDDNDTSSGGDGRHHLDKLADLVSEAHGMDRPTSIRWLMHTKEGRAFAVTHKRETAMQNIEKMKRERVAKLEAMSVTDIAKGAIVAGTDFLLGGEPEFTALVTKAAQREWPTLSKDAAFAKMFSAGDERGKLLRQAFNAVKNLPVVLEVAPMYVGGEANRGGDVSPNNPRSALDQINALVERARATAPFKTTAQLFAEVYRNNPRLAEQERRENRPRPGDHPSYPAQ